MPANITVKKADGTTDQVWTGIKAGGTSQNPAVWQITSGSALGQRPEMRYFTRPAGKNMVEVRVTVQWPVLSTDTTTSITTEIGRQKFEGTWHLNQNLAQVIIDELVQQSANLSASAILQAFMRVGATPNS